MTTTAAGDVAVARLNKATEAFEKIITGASNQVVDVPGYGNQPTLAARVDQRLDETTATAAAEANRSRDEADRATIQANAAANSVTQAAAEYNKAKTQADRAQSEADRAAQITGLDTVSDAVALAALPLPDVWAPLTDSLRLFVGNGREVKVGDDVVARYVNYSRSTAATYTDKNNDVKVAAINEPRFERNGLLIDGQSTNLIPTSATLTTQTLAVQAGTHTLSFYGTGSVLLSGVATGTIAGAGANNRVALTFTATAGNLTLTVTGVCTYGQLEALPFASSYIPTNGAVVTRAAGLATLPQSLNLGESQLGFGLAVEFDSVNTGGGRLLELSDLSSVILDGATVTIRHAGKEVYGANAPLGQRHHLAYSVAADGAITAALNGKLLALQTRSAGSNSSKSVISLGNLSNGSGGRPLYGHLRDLKIWTKKPLTADQLKVASA